MAVPEKDTDAKASFSVGAIIPDAHMPIIVDETTQYMVDPRTRMIFDVRQGYTASSDFTHTYYHPEQRSFMLKAFAALGAEAIIVVTPFGKKFSLQEVLGDIPFNGHHMYFNFDGRDNMAIEAGLTALLRTPDEQRGARLATALGRAEDVQERAVTARILDALGVSATTQEALRRSTGDARGFLLQQELDAPQTLVPGPTIREPNWCGES